MFAKPLGKCLFLEFKSSLEVSTTPAATTNILAFNAMRFFKFIVV
ncbi:hypothetical protein [Campylobacter hyointestinalis]|nr:hypothetical protein [Campylobacter hyointestinalis]